TGYLADDTPIRIELTTRKQAKTESLTNTPVTGTVSFTKVNNWDIALPGAVFTLTDQTTGSDLVLTETSNGSGVVTFSDVPFGVYELEEITAPDNHELSPTKYSLEIDSSGVLITGWDEEIVNQIKGGGITVTLTDADTGLPLSDITFKVFDSSSRNRSTGMTNSSGVVVFSGLMVGETYRIVQTIPAGYYPTAEHSITVALEQNYNISWYDYPIAASIEINKVDSQNASKKLQGVSFGLYLAGDPDTLLETGLTDVNGKLVFRNLELTLKGPATSSLAPILDELEYIVKELATITGYNLNTSPYNVTLTDRTEEAALTVTNVPVAGGGDKPPKPPVEPPKPPVEPPNPPDEPKPPPKPVIGEPVFPITKDHIWYIQGYPDGTIRPNGDITREEVAMVFWRLSISPDKNDPVASLSYPDVKPGRWSYQAITYLSSVGVLLGYPSGDFLPKNPITRGELAAILSRIYVLELEGTNLFSDIAGHWAVDYIDNVSVVGWMQGYPNGLFRPQNKTTRAEFCTAINRMLSRKLAKEDADDKLNIFSDLKKADWGYQEIIEAAYTHDYERATIDDYERWTKIYPKD
ncbi:MAG: SpaA isopeptide-forming pilin-related protein, partial [Clostridiales bacterium]|nr:SpaA isopeptide-forming pilin-related protein [Clostridiales bacterium]